jgi:hypothetical protein
MGNRFHFGVRAVSPSFELNFLGTIVGIIAAAGLIGAAERAGIGKERRRDALKPGGRRHRDTLKPS